MKIVVVAIVLFFSQFVSAEEQTAEPSLQSYLDKLNSYEANFQQQRYSVNRQLLDTTSGRFVLKRPSQFVWQTYSPFEQTISSDGETIWTMDIDLEQVIISPVDQQIENAPIYLLTEAQQTIEEVFEIEHQVVEKVDYFVLLPKDESGAFERLRIGFNAGTLASLELYDSLGQLTRINMTNIRNNPLVDVSQFSLSIPEDYDIIDNRPISDPNP